MQTQTKRRSKSEKTSPKKFSTSVSTVAADSEDVEPLWDESSSCASDSEPEKQTAKNKKRKN